MDGKSLKELREKLKLSQEQIGRSLGISKAAVSKLENEINKMSRPVDLLCRQLQQNSQQ